MNLRGKTLKNGKTIKGRDYINNQWCYVDESNLPILGDDIEIGEQLAPPYYLGRYVSVCHRSADLESFFLAVQGDIDLVKKAIEDGETLSLGEVAGKNSNITLYLEKEELVFFEEITYDTFVFMLKAMGGVAIGQFDLAYILSCKEA